nr:thiamine pyrophosphate-dependent dehydrogenase E1 component subunit alpha [Sphingomonas sp. Y57]
MQIDNDERSPSPAATNGLPRTEAYRRMLRIRRFEEEGTRLYIAGKIPGSFHASIGQEAAIVGACMAVEDNDPMTGTHRSHGHPIGKGARLRALMAELMGKRTGVCGGRGGSMHLADGSVGIVGESAIVGGGIPIATGCALTAKVMRTGQVALCFFGDGAVNQGVFHESLNMASLWRLPVIYLCENNGYAITTSLAASHAQTSIARRADSYGMPGVVVDGQDVIAVHAAAREAADRARTGLGPTLIEAQTHRFDEHQVGLLLRIPYRSKDEVEQHRATRDPIMLFRDRMLAEGVTSSEVAAVESDVEVEVADAIQFGFDSPEPELSSLFDDMFSQPINYPSRQDLDHHAE